MVAFVACESEQTFFQKGVAPIPQGEGKADELMAIAKASDPVLTPAVGARARVVVRKIVPGLAVRAVVFANGPPLSLAQVRPPTLPMSGPQARFLEPLLFARHALAFGLSRQLSPRLG